MKTNTIISMIVAFIAAIAISIAKADDLTPTTTTTVATLHRQMDKLLTETKKLSDDTKAELDHTKRLVAYVKRMNARTRQFLVLVDRMDKATEKADTDRIYADMQKNIADGKADKMPTK